MKKIYIFIFSFTIALFIFRPLQLRSQDVSIGYRTGFYLSHSVSVEKYINRFTSIEVNAGHRFNGGLINQSSENFSRTGAIINVKQFFHRSFDPYYYYTLYNKGPKFFWTVGIAASSVNEGKSVKSSYANMGILAGLGVDLRIKGLITSFTFLPSYDFVYGPYKNRFVWYRGTGIAIRKPL
jgi:hypothetical protein